MCLTRLAETGDISSAMRLAGLLQSAGYLDRAEYWWRRLAMDGYTVAVQNLGLVLHARGETEGGKELLAKSAHERNTLSMRLLAQLLAREGDREGALMWFETALSRGDLNAHYEMGELGFPVRRLSRAQRKHALRRGALDSDHSTSWWR